MSGGGHRLVAYITLVAILACAIAAVNLSDESDAASGSSISGEVGEYLEVKIAARNATSSSQVDNWSFSDDLPTGLSVEGRYNAGAGTASRGEIWVYGTPTQAYTGTYSIVWAPSSGSTSTITYTGSVTITGGEPADVPVTSIAISGSTSVTEGDSVTYSVTVSPSNATNKAVTWSVSSGPATIASQDDDSCVVSFTGTGIVVIRATADDGSGTYDTHTISVSAATTSGADITGTRGFPLEVKIAARNATSSSQVNNWDFTYDLPAGLSVEGRYNAGVGTASRGEIWVYGTPTQEYSGSYSVRWYPSSGSSSSILYTGNADIIEPVPVTSITISGPTSAIQGDSETYTASVNPSTATDGAVTWSIASGTASITSQDDDSCVVSFTGTGIVVIKATADDGSGVTDELAVDVEAGEYNAPDIEGIVGYELEIKIAARNATSESSMSGWVLTADLPAGLSVEKRYNPSAGTASRGEIWVVGTPTSAYEGDYSVTWRASASGTPIYYTGQATITEPVLVTTVTVFGADTVTEGTQETYTASVSPTNATNKAVTWSVSGPATITSQDDDSCVVSFTGTGSVTVTATADDDSGVSGNRIVTVESSTQVSLAGPSSVYVGNEIEITATVTGGDSAGVEWQTPTGTGSVGTPVTTSTTWTATATGIGSVTIRAVADDDSGVYDEITVEILDAPLISDVTIQISGSTSAKVGESRTLTAVVLPSDLGNRTVTWTVVTGSDLITYDTTTTWRGGELTYQAEGTGSVTIRAVANADEDAVATISITISSATSDDSHIISPGGITQVIGDALFDGNATIAGVVLFAIILGILFAIIREPLPVVLLGIPIMGVFTLLGLLDMNMVILLIIVTAVGLALIARNMWRD